MINHKTMLDNVPNEIKPYLNKKNYQKGSYIIHSGEQNDSLFFLIEGTAEVIILTYKGTNQSIKLLKAFEVFGELEIFDPSYKTNSIIAKEDCTILKIHRDYIFEWMKIDPNFSKYLLELIAAFYIESCSQSARLTVLTIKQRLLVSIYLHNKNNDLSSVTKDLLIQEIRAPKRSLNRSIQECVAEGYITYTNKSFQIINPERLTSFVDPLL